MSTRLSKQNKAKQAMANKEVLDAITASTNTYLQAVESSKQFYVETINAVEERLTKQMEKVNANVKENTTNINNITVRVGTVETTVRELVEFKKNHEDRTMEMENRSVMGEYHNMKFNIIIENLKQEKDWESHDELLDVFKTFLNLIEVDSAPSITAIHRLRTHSGRKPLPLIVKVLTLKDRDNILDNASNLKSVNSTLTAPIKVYQQIPYRMQQDKRELKTTFDDARIRGGKPKYKLDSKTARFYLKVGDNKFYPKRKTIKYVANTGTSS